jgi:hypothetical protein
MKYSPSDPRRKVCEFYLLPCEMDKCPVTLNTICRNKDCWHILSHSVWDEAFEKYVPKYCPNPDCFYHTHEQTEKEERWRKIHD